MQSSLGTNVLGAELTEINKQVNDSSYIPNQTRSQRHVEKIRFRSMNTAFSQMLLQLEEFKATREEFKHLQDKKDQEMVITNRLIKKEVIDIADNLDDL